MCWSGLEDIVSPLVDDRSAIWEFRSQFRDQVRSLPLHLHPMISEDILSRTQSQRRKLFPKGRSANLHFVNSTCLTIVRSQRRLLLVERSWRSQNIFVGRRKWLLVCPEMSDFMTVRHEYQNFFVEVRIFTSSEMSNFNGPSTRKSQLFWRSANPHFVKREGLMFDMFNKCNLMLSEKNLVLWVGGTCCCHVLLFVKVFLFEEFLVRNLLLSRFGATCSFFDKKGKGFPLPPTGVFGPLLLAFINVHDRLSGTHR